jgi:peptide/nickel transport system substrate-binding protein
LEITIHQIELAQQLPDVTIFETVTAQTGIARMQVDMAPFSDRRVRNAIQACIDHEEMLRLAYAGRGAVGEDHHCAPIHPEYAQLPKQRQDYQRARALLAEAGYSDGLKLTLDINGAEPWETDAAQVLAQMLRPAGISLDLNIMPGTLFWDIWDQTPFGITGWTHRPLGVMVYNLAYATGAPWNETHFADPEFDRLLGEANGKINPAERRETMAKLEKILQDSGIMVQALWRSIFTAGRKNIRNFQLHPTQYHQFFSTWMA